MKLSIIIPTHNEEKVIEKTLLFLNKHKQKTTQIIIVDGNSVDKTAIIAKKYGATLVISKQKGRSQQLTTGAKHAKGDVFYFLHADTIPPKTFEDDIINAITTNHYAGAFNLTFDKKHWFLTQCVRIVNMLGWHFGDKSFFITKELYNNIGGFRPLAIMEDYDIVRRSRKKTKFMLFKNKYARTSARKYEQVGVFKLHFIYLILFLLYLIGCSQKTLVNIYKKLV